MKRIASILLFFVVSAPFMSIHAQSNLENFMADELADFNKFLDEANKEFIEFLRDPWKEETPKPAQKALEKPKPTTVPVAPKTATPVAKSTTPSNTVPATAVTSTPVAKATPAKKAKDGEFNWDADEPGEINGKGGNVEQIKTKNPDAVKKTTPTKTVVVEKAQPETSTTPATPVAKTTTPTTPVAKTTTPATPVVKTETPATPTVKTTTPVSPVVKTETPTTPVAKTSVPSTPVVSTPAASSDPVFTGGGNRVKIDYLGTPLYVDATLKNKVTLSGIKEDNVADAVQAVSSIDYKTIVSDIQKAQKQMCLNGWGVALLVKAASDALATGANERIVMRMFLLTQLGYKCSVARTGDNKKLALLVAPDAKLYDLPYVSLDGVTFYDIDNVLGTNPFYLPKKLNSKSINKVGMQLTQVPNIGTKTDTESRTNSADNSVATTSVSDGQMQLYKKYPHCEFSVYINAKVSPEFANPVLNDLKAKIAGKSETEAVSYLLSWVQHSFAYATDDEQFGYEKPFFVEEMFYYPKDDCEDRSIMLSYLIRKLTNLKISLLDYPNHIATGIVFSGDVSGDHVMHNGKKYVVCDPTYIGAGIGMAQPTFKNTTPKVLDL